jgi:hypothetical protein
MTCGIPVWIVGVQSQAVSDSSEVDLDKFVYLAKVSDRAIPHFEVNRHVEGLSGLDTIVSLRMDLSPELGSLEFNRLLWDLSTQLVVCDGSGHFD